MEKENNLLIDFVQNGNRKSFEELYKMTKPWLYRLIYSIVPIRDDADEILQQTWIKVLETAPRFDIQKGKFNNYLYTIAKNKSLKWKNSRKRFVFENEQHDNSDDFYGIDSNNPHNQSELFEKNQILKESIMKLDKDYQDVILLHYLSELDVKEISVLLNKPDGTIKTWLSRGREQLKKVLLKSNYKYYMATIILLHLISIALFVQNTSFKGELK